MKTAVLDIPSGDNLIRKKKNPQPNNKNTTEEIGIQADCSP